MLLFALLLSIATLRAAFLCIEDCTEEFQKSISQGIPYTLGSFLTLLFMTAVLYFLIKYSFKLMQNKPSKKRTSEIDEIGK